MSTEQENPASASDSADTPEKPLETHDDETLTDLLDRMDREAFHRSLELRDAHLTAHRAGKR